MGALKLKYYNENKPLKVVFSNFSETLEKKYPVEKNCLDYFTFGMLLPNRHESSNDYRYGFQGQEKDDEIKGEGNSVNYKYRMHDARIGRFFAVDPLTSNYPHYSPYSFSGNKVIHRVELEGMEDVKFDLPSQDPNIRYLDADRIDHLTKQEYLDLMKVRGMVGAAGAIVYGIPIAVAYFGTAAVGAFIAEELTEAVIEEVFGVPIIVDPVDLVEWFTKKGYKKLTKKAIKEAGQKLRKDFISTRNISKKIDNGKQGKHIDGHNNYKTQKTNGKNPSLLETDGQKLLDDVHAGNFKKVEVISDTKTRVEFDYPIGKYIDPKTGEAVETTVGIVHNSKNGAHIVPARPVIE